MATEQPKVEGEQPDLTQTEAAKELAAAVEGAKSEGDPAVETKTAGAAKQPAESWQEKKFKERTAKLTAQKKDLEAKVAQLEAKALQPAVPPEAEVQRQIDAKAEVKAREIAAQQVFNDKTGKVLEAGRADYPDFLERVETLRSAVLDPTDAEASSRRYAGLVNGILETAEDDPKVSAKLIHLIGSDPETAERLAGLSPVRLGKELSKMAEQPPVEPVSGAPKPPSVLVGGRAPSHVAIDPGDASRSDRLSMAEWMSRRNAQVAENRKNGIRMA